MNNHAARTILGTITAAVLVWTLANDIIHQRTHAVDRWHTHGDTRDGYHTHTPGDAHAR